MSLQSALGNVPVTPFPHFFLLRSLLVSNVTFHKIDMHHNGTEFNVRLILLMDLNQTWKMSSHFSETVQSKVTLKSRSVLS